MMDLRGYCFPDTSPRTTAAYALDSTLMDDPSVDGLFFDGQHLSVGGFDFSSVHGFAACTSSEFWLSSWMIGSSDSAARHDLLDGSFGGSETFVCSAALFRGLGDSLASCAAVLLEGTILDAGVAPRAVPLVASAVVDDASLVLVVRSCGGLVWGDVLADGDPRCCVRAADNSLCAGVGGLMRGFSGGGVRVMIVTAVVSAAIITEWGTVTTTGGTSMMLVSAKAVAVRSRIFVSKTI